MSVIAFSKSVGVAAEKDLAVDGKSSGQLDRSGIDINSGLNGSVVVDDKSCGVFSAAVETAEDIAAAGVGNDSCETVFSISSESSAAGSFALEGHIDAAAHDAFDSGKFVHCDLIVESVVALDGQVAVTSGVNALIGGTIVDHGGGIGSCDFCLQTIVGTAQCQSGVALKSLFAVEGGALGHGHGAVSDGAFTFKDQLAVGTVVKGNSGFVGHDTCVGSPFSSESSGTGGHGKLVEDHIGAAAHDAVDGGSARNAEIVGKSMGSGDGQIAVAAAENGGVCAVSHGGQHTIISVLE